MKTGADELDKAKVSRAYARWAPVYDFVFGKVFDPGRQAAIWRRKISAAASSKSALAPAYRYPTTHARIGSSASISASRCCARLASASRLWALIMSTGSR